jgi:hypothetical protein
MMIAVIFEMLTPLILPKALSCLTITLKTSVPYANFTPMALTKKTLAS